MHPLHDHIASRLAELVRTRRVVVWYDLHREFTSFVAELHGPVLAVRASMPITLAGSAAHLVTYDGSFLEMRAILEPLVAGDTPEPVVVYVPGCAWDRRGSVLMELDLGGCTWERRLRKLAREVLLERYTLGTVDDLVAPERPLSYEDLARAAMERPSSEPPSLLRIVFPDATATDDLLAAWLASDGRDADITAKGAVQELIKLVRSRLGLELPNDNELPRLRAHTLRYVLAGEFRLDLRGPPPTSLDAVPMPANADAVRVLARHLRAQFAEAYPELADRVESELGLRDAKIAADTLGAIDTFRFEERALLTHCGDLISAKRFDEALVLVRERDRSFWLDRDLGRKTQWVAYGLMAELGRAAKAVGEVLARMPDDPNRWVDAYTARDGWHRMDRAQRDLEAWLIWLDEEPEERPLGLVRRAYEDACMAMTVGFSRVLTQAGWTVSDTMHQTRVYRDVVADRPRPVAYFLVDAMRYEMGVELAERLPKTVEVSVRPAIAALPSITPVCMAALLPGAAASFAVVSEGGKLGARIDGVFLPDLPARKKFTAARVPKVVDLTLDDLLGLTSSKLARKLDGAQVVVVRSQEIDHAGETGSHFPARRVMDAVISNLARALRKLATAGIEHAVVTADHGHLFFGDDRDESMRTDAPGGDTVELHRRCWIGRGGATPSGCVRVGAAALGYESDLELVFPRGSGVFRAGGDLAFHHGGPSLQELVIPVLVVRWKATTPEKPVGRSVQVSGLPETLSNRIFSVSVSLGGAQLAIGDASVSVRPLLMHAGRQVGGAIVAVGADHDRVTGCVMLKPGQPAMVGFLLSEENIPTFRLVVQDPASDAELYRSPSDIPFKSGV